MSHDPYAPPQSPLRPEPESADRLLLRHKFLFTLLLAFLFRFVFSDDFNDLTPGWQLLSLLLYPASAGLVAIFLPTERVEYFLPASLILAFPVSGYLGRLIA